MAYQNWPEGKKNEFKNWIVSENHRNAKLLRKDVNRVPNVGWTTELQERTEEDKFKKKHLRRIAQKAGIVLGDNINTVGQKLLKMIRDENDNKKAEASFEASCFISFFYLDSECIIDEVHENKKDVMVPVYGQSYKEQMNLPENPTIDDINQAIAEIGA